MSYFNDDDDIPLDEIAKFFQEMQKHLFSSMQNGDLGSNVKRFGFSIHVGKDGVPHIAPITDQNMPPFNMAPNMNPGMNNNGFEEPFMDVFFSDENAQIIAEVPGVTDISLVVVSIDGNEFTLHAEEGPYKYRKSLLLKHELDKDSVDMHLRNGVLEINVKFQ